MLDEFISITGTWNILVYAGNVMHNDGNLDNWLSFVSSSIVSRKKTKKKLLSIMGVLSDEWIMRFERISDQSGHSAEMRV